MIPAWIIRTIVLPAAESVFASEGFGQGATVRLHKGGHEPLGCRRTGSSIPAIGIRQGRQAWLPGPSTNGGNMIVSR